MVWLKAQQTAGLETGPGSGELELSGVQMVVASFFLQQLVVAALLLDLSVLNDHDAVGVTDGGEAVGDDKHGPALHQGIHSLLDERLCTLFYRHQLIRNRKLF